MDDIHVYLPDGMRVVISEDLYMGLLVGYRFMLQAENQGTWGTVQSTHLPWIGPTELESRVDETICDLMGAYERRIKREQADFDAASRLRKLFHGKIRDVKCPPKEATANDSRT